MQHSLYIHCLYHIPIYIQWWDLHKGKTDETDPRKYSKDVCHQRDHMKLYFWYNKVHSFKSVPRRWIMFIFLPIFFNITFNSCFATISIYALIFRAIPCFCLVHTIFIVFRENFAWAICNIRMHIAMRKIALNGKTRILKIDIYLFYYFDIFVLVI